MNRFELYYILVLTDSGLDILVTTGSGNGLAPLLPWAITHTIVGLLYTGP